MCKEPLRLVVSVCLDGLVVMGPWALGLTYFEGGSEVATMETDLLRGGEVSGIKRPLKILPLK